MPNQGAVAVMMQKLDSVIAKQLGVPNTLDYGCTSQVYSDSAASDLSDVEDGAEAITDLIDSACDINQGRWTLLRISIF